MMSPEYRIIGGGSNYAHVATFRRRAGVQAAPPAVHLVMDILDLYVEIGKAGRRKQGINLSRCRQISRPAGEANGVPRRIRGHWGHGTIMQRIAFVSHLRG